MIETTGRVDEFVLERSQLDTVTFGSSASKAPRFEWLDGMRAYAILGVVLVHSGQRVWIDGRASGASRWLERITELGQYGVQLFFVISAITVFYTLGRFELRFSSFRSWLIKRYLRVAPLYYIAIAVYFCLGFFGNYLRARSGKALLSVFTPADAIANMLFIHTWIPHANNDVVPGGWSIGVEMMFYLIAPLCFALIGVRRWGLILISLLGFLSLGISMRVAGGHVVNNTYFYYWLPTQFPVILCGIVLCHVCKKWLLTSKPNPSLATSISFVVSILSFILAAFYGVFFNWNTAYAPLLMGISFSGLAILARDPLRSVFANPLTVRLGRLSYSIYIIHFAVLSVVGLVQLKLPVVNSAPDALKLIFVLLITLGVSIPFAMFLQRTVEEPSIKFGRRLSVSTR